MLAPTEAAAWTHAEHSAFWTGRLSMLVACFLAGQMDKRDLRTTYRVLRSPACTPELLAMLREVSR